MSDVEKLLVAFYEGRTELLGQDPEEAHLNPDDPPVAIGKALDHYDESYEEDEIERLMAKLLDTNWAIPHGNSDTHGNYWYLKFTRKGFEHAKELYEMSD
jgi:hypothetical protein